MYTIDMLVLLYFGKFLHELSQWQLKLPLHSNSPACSIIIFITQYHFLSLNNSSDKVSVENLHGGIMGFNGLIIQGVAQLVCMCTTKRIADRIGKVSQATPFWCSFNLMISEKETLLSCVCYKR